MKHLKQLLTAALAMLLALVVATPAWAAGTGTITITPPSGVDASATNTYKIYKVFDADGDGTNISYKVMSGKTGVPDVAAQMASGYDPATVDHFILDDAGNVRYGTETTVDGKTVITDSSATELSEAAVKAVAAYVAGDTEVDTATSTGSADAVSKALPNGYYYITTSTGTVVTIDSTNPAAEVDDKNTVPEVNKKITGEVKIDEAGKKAIQEVGKDVNYEAVITLGKGFENYGFTDTMTNQVLKGEPVVKSGTTTFVKDTDYTLTPAAGNAGFSIAFLDDGAIKNLSEGAEITITYVGTVTSNALTVDSAKNTAYVTYGDDNSNNKTPVTETEVYNATIGVEKTDGKTKTALEGAGFKLKNSEGKFYKYNATDKKIEWVAEGQADEKFTGADGKLTEEFKGLAAGTYTLVESTVPAGYNKAADTDVTITNKSVEATNLDQDAKIENNKGVELPSTGGMGTTILYIVGGIMVAGAIVVLITKKRVNSIEK